MKHTLVFFISLNYCIQFVMGFSMENDFDLEKFEPLPIMGQPQCSKRNCEGVITEEDCHNLDALCTNCTYPMVNGVPDCIYGKTVNVQCQIDGCREICKSVFMKEVNCRYCYQTKPFEEYTCESITNCSVTANPYDRYVRTICTVHDNVYCIGQRKFYKMIACNWTSGKRWSTAVLLSVTLGGFGADRFYLGLWQSGLGKLFSFGGLGIWTIIDVVLIGLGYVGPGDGSLYLNI